MTETLATSGMVKLKAGANASVLTADQYTALINEAESMIVDATRVDYVASFSGLTASKKYLLQDATSCYGAISVINYDMSGYSSRSEALIMINILWARFKECLNLLLNKDTQAWVSKA